jgi:GGDEF domain-containing protein
VSIGICVFPNGIGESEFFPEILKTTYNRADEAMYEAKMMSRKDDVIG